MPILKAGHRAPRLRAGRRDFALRDVQRSQRLHQELPVHAQAHAEGHRGGFRSAGARDSGHHRPERHHQRHDARRQRGALHSACPQDYDPTDRQQVLQLFAGAPGDAIVTGLLYVDESVADLHEMNQHAGHGAVASAVREAVPRRGGTRTNCRKISGRRMSETHWACRLVF